MTIRPASPGASRSEPGTEDRRPVFDRRPEAAEHRRPGLGVQGEAPARTTGRESSGFAAAPPHVERLGADVAAEAVERPHHAEARLGAADAPTRTAVLFRLQGHVGNAGVQRVVRPPSIAAPRGGRTRAADPMPGDAGGVDDAAEQSPDAGSAGPLEALLPGLGGHGGSGGPGGPEDPGGGDASRPRGGPRRSTPAPVQRHETGASHPHPHTTSWQALRVHPDVIGILDDLPALLAQVNQMEPEAPGPGRQPAPPEVAQPAMAAIVTEDKTFITDPAGRPWSVVDTEHAIAVSVDTVVIVEFSRGAVWQLGTRGGAINAIPSSMGARRQENVAIGRSGLFILLPGIVGGVPEIMDEFQRRVRTSERARRRAAGPPGWAREQGRRLSRRLRDRRTGPSGPGGTGGDGPGLGREGAGTGGGGDARTGEPGTGGTGGGTGSGDRQADRTPPQVPPVPGRGADDVVVTVNGNGDPICVVTADGATTTIPMRSGESDDDLLSRADEAADRLRHDRSAAASERLIGGATATGFRPSAAGAGAGEEVNADAARSQAGAGAGATPGERVPGAPGGANTPAYPSELRAYGMQPPRAPITVRGASNSFSMELDRGTDVFNYLQPINFYWELIEVTGMQAEDRARASATTGVGAGERVGRGSGIGRDIAREHAAIWEDVSNEDWITIAGQYQLIALSSAVRSLGSIVTAFFATVTTPRNEQSIGFDKEGDFVLRCVATPVVDHEWLERHGVPRERQLIRASSVATLPIRIQNIATRASEVNRTEESDIEAKRAELEEARRTGAAAAEITRLEQELAALLERRGHDSLRSLSSSIDDLQRLLDALDRLEAADRDGVPLERRPVDVLELDVGIRFANVTRADFRRQTTAALEARRGQRTTATRWAGDLTRHFRPRVTFASEVNGQVIQMVMVLGEHRDSREGARHWVLADVTSPSTQQRYHGRSNAAGTDGHVAAIRGAFVDFRENGEYGRGSIAIGLPEELREAVGVPVPIESVMRAAPGRTGRQMRRLQDLATVAAVAGLVVTGPAGLAIGAVGGLAGAAVATHRMLRRAEGERLRMDFETFTDIVDIVGGITGVLSVGTAAIGAAARRGTSLARAGASVEDLASAASSFRWVQRMEMTDRALHIFGLVQNVGQGVIIIPYSLFRELQSIDADADASPGQKRARRMLALARAMQSGTMTVISTAQSLRGGTPEVTPDSVVWDRLASAASPGAEGGPAPSGGDGHTARIGEGTVPPDVPGPSVTRPVEDATPTARRPEPEVIRIDPPTVDTTNAGPAGPSGAGRGTPEGGATGPGTPEPVGGGRGAGDRAPGEGGPAPQGGTAPTTAPAGTPSGPTQLLGASAVLAAAQRIIAGNRAEPPPAGRIRYVAEADFAPHAGGDATVVGMRDPSGVLTISIDRAMAAGLVPRLRALVAARLHSLARRHLGDAAASALTQRLASDVLAGDPTPLERSAGDGVVDRLQSAVGTRALLETLLQGNLGAIRDPLRQRFGNARAEAILAAARRGAADTMAGLLAEPSAAFADRYGIAEAAVGDLIAADLGGQARDRARLELARALADAVGGDVLREAYASGDPARVDAALDAALGSRVAGEVRRALQEGRGRDALAALRTATPDARTSRGPADTAPARVAPDGSQPATEAPAGVRPTGPETSTTTSEPAAPARSDAVPAHAADAATEFAAALGGDAATAGSRARTLLEQLGNFKFLRRLVEEGAIGTPDQRQAVKDGLQATREAITNDILGRVKAAVEQRFPNVELVPQNMGTPGFGSDIDVTLQARPRPGADPPPTVNELVAASTEAVRDAYAAARERGFDPDRSLDTNFYTELHEGAMQPTGAAERIGIASDQSVVSLTEMRMGMNDAQWAAYREAQLRAIDGSGAPDAFRRQMRQSMERQFVAADERSARLGRGEQALVAARERLLEALRRTDPPATTRELRDLMADVKLLEPDAFGTRAAVESVVYGQQGMARAETPEAQARAAEHLGTVGRGATSLPEQIAHRAQQAEAALAHFFSHFPESGIPAPSEARALAKQLGRVAHAFREGGLSVRSRLVDEAGAVVGAKQETDSDAATMREIRGWAEDSGIRARSDRDLLRLWAQEATRVATDMSTRLRTSQELARVAHPEGDEGYRPATRPAPGGSTPPVAPTPTGGAGSAPGPAGSAGGSAPSPTTRGPGAAVSEGGGRPGEAGGVPAPQPLPAALAGRVAELRRRIDTLGSQSGQARRAAEWRRALDEVLARRDLLVDDVETIVSSIEEGLGGPAPLRDTPLVTLDAHDPGVQASLRDALGDPALAGDPLWARYVEAVLHAYERAGVLEVGASPRQTDAARIQETGAMRVAFLRAIDGGGANQVGAQLFREHVQWARASAGNDAAAVARGDLVWIDPVSGETLAAHRAGAVVWPADPVWGAWRVDHAVELQHGGADDPSNYIPITQRMHGPKTDALAAWTRRHAATRAQAQAEGADLVGSGMP